MTTLLFIAPADLGETVLATGALEFVRTPDVQITIVCGKDAADLFRATPGVVDVQIVEAGRFRGLLTLARRFGGTPFDLTLDLTGRRVAFGARSRKRIVRRAPRELRHVLDEFAALVSAERLAPKIWLDDEARKTAAVVAPTGEPLLALAPGAADARKIWPAERFAAAARRIAGGAGPLSGTRVLVLGAAADGEIAQSIAQSLDADGMPALNLAGRLDLLATATLLGRTTLCVAVENPLMQIAAAMGAATLGLFGPSDERIVGPRGPRTRALRGRSFEDVMANSGDHTAMDALSVDAVEAAALDLLRAGGL
ncbi:MAG: glycosyltransferase family 9 protein [Terricaulis silvestris]